MSSKFFREESVLQQLIPFNETLWWLSVTGVASDVVATGVATGVVSDVVTIGVAAGVSTGTVVDVSVNVAVR